MCSEIFGNQRGRPKIERIIEKTSNVRLFGPIDDKEYVGIKISLTKEEFESIRLKNIENFDIIEAGNKMGIGKSTFANIYNSAISKLTNALVYGYQIEIE